MNNVLGRTSFFVSLLFSLLLAFGCGGPGNESGNTSDGGSSSPPVIPPTQSGLNYNLPTPNITSVTRNADFSVTIDWGIPVTDQPDGKEIAGFEIYMLPPNAVSAYTELSPYEIDPSETLLVNTFTTTVGPLGDGMGEYQFRLRTYNEIDEVSPLNIPVTLNVQGDLDFVRKFNSFNSGDSFYNPQGIAVDSSGKIYVADTLNHRILEFNSAGALQRSFGSQGSGLRQFYQPMGLVMDSSDQLYVADSGNDRVVKFDPDSFSSTWETFGSTSLGVPVPGTATGNFDLPVDVAVDSSGRLLVVDVNNRRIQRLTFNSGSSTGNASIASVFEWGNASLDQFQGLWSIDVVGTDVYVMDRAVGKVYKFEDSGEVFDFKFGGTVGGSGNSDLSNPRGIAVDTTNNLIYIADTGNQRIQVFTTAGVAHSRWSMVGSDNGEFLSPWSLTYKNGKLYTSDIGNPIISDSGDRIQIFQ